MCCFNYKSSFYLIVKFTLCVLVLAAVGLILTTGGFKWRYLISLMSSVALFFLGKWIYENQKRYSLVFIALTIIFTSPLLIQKLLNINILFSNYTGTLRIGVGISCIVFALNILFKKYWFNNYILIVLISIPLIAILIMWGYFFSIEACITDDTLLAIAQTNIYESLEWIKDFVGYGTFSAVSFGLLSIGFIFYQLTKIKCKYTFREYRKLFAIFILLIGGFVLMASGRKRDVCYASFLNVHNTFKKYKEFQIQLENRTHGVAPRIEVEAKDSNGVYVLVLGESQNRDHMQVYGYNRKTTPWLQEYVNNNQVLLFKNMYSCHVHTVPVLTYALTAKNQYNNMDLANSISILDVAKAAGYNTAWISNQVKYGAWDTPNTVIASTANQQFWLNRQIGETTKTNSYDASLVEKIDKLKISNKMLIVFHLMGNHGSYSERYPQSFKCFNEAKSQDENNIDHYDNSMLYNDYVIKNIYEKCSKLPNFKGLIYCSDHAEAVKEGLGHNTDKFTHDMTHIPFYMMLDDSYIKSNTEKYRLLQDNRDTVITNDMLFNIVISVMNIKVPSIYEEENDILSVKYNKDINRFKTLYGKEHISSDSIFYNR